MPDYQQVVPTQHRDLAVRIYTSLADNSARMDPTEESEGVLFRFRLKKTHVAFARRLDAAIRESNPNPNRPYAADLAKRLAACLPLYRALMSVARSDTEKADWKLDLDNVEQAYNFACEEARKA